MVVKLIHADCIEAMRSMPECSVDAIVCDPPFLLGFMSKDFDKQNGAHTDPQKMQQWHYQWAVEALRVIKPGGHAFVAGIGRTHHRMMCAFEDSGWEVRDVVCHVFGSGLPKSLDVSKAIDKMAGTEQEVVGTYITPDGRNYLKEPQGRKPRFDALMGAGSSIEPYRITAPATDAAKQWAGYGTALKPAVEFWTLFRRPLSEPTVAANVLRWNTGAINIGGSRIGNQGWTKLNGVSGAGFKTGKFMGAAGRGEPTQQFGLRESTQGRWPANLILNHISPDENGNGGCVKVGMKKVKPLEGYRPNPVQQQADGQIKFNEKPEGYQKLSYTDPDGYEQVDEFQCVEGCPIRILNEQVGPQKSAGTPRRRFADKTKNVFGKFNGEKNPNGIGPSSGPVSRFFLNIEPEMPFFYCPKSSRAERNKGCENFEIKTVGHNMLDTCANCGGRILQNPDRPSACKCENPVRVHNQIKGNSHPTCKPVKLMRYLIRLVTPPGGIVLDPFAGSGTTLVAAMREGFSAIGIEKEEEYVEICKARIAAEKEDMGLFATGNELWPEVPQP